MTRTILSKCLMALIPVAVAAAALPAPAKALDKVKVVIPRNSAFVLSYYGGRDAGIYKKHGIDLQIDARPFAGFLAGLPSKECMVTTYAGTAAISRINKGLDWVIIGGGLTVMQQVFVRDKEPIHKITDLKGKKFASWSTGAGAFKALRAAVLDGYNFDVLHDTKFDQIAAPALFKFLGRGDVDAMFNISSLTITAASEGGKFRSVFSPNAYWKKKTGYPIVWSGPIVAWRSWVDADRDRAKRFVAATHEAFRWLRDPKHLDTVVQKYGTLAAVHNQAEANTYKKWLKDKRVFLAHWDQKTMDAEWKFLDVAKKYGVISKVPSEKKYGLVLQ